MIVNSMWAWARRWRRTGSVSLAFCWARATRRSSSLAERELVTEEGDAAPKASVARATRQPSPISPTTLSTEVRAPSKKTSLNSLVRVSCMIGRTSTPGWSIGTSRYDSPCGGWCRGRFGRRRSTSRPVGQRRPDLLAGDEPFVAVTDGFGLDVGEVAAGVGFGIALAPESRCPGGWAGGTAASVRVCRNG